MKNLKLSILLTSILGAAIYIYSNTKFFKQSFINFKLNSEQKLFIKKHIFPYKMIDQQAEKNLKLTKKLNETSIYLSELELLKKNSVMNIGTIRSNYDLPEADLLKLNNNNLEKFRLTSGFYSGIHDTFPGTGYIDFYEDDLVIVSSKGILAFSKNFPSDKVIFNK